MQISVNTTGVYVYQQLGVVNIEEVKEDLVNSILSNGHIINSARVLNEHADVEMEFKDRSRLISVKEGSKIRVSDAMGDDEFSVVSNEEAREVCKLILSIRDKQGGG